MKNVFALSNESVDYQLSVHMMNMVQSLGSTRSMLFLFKDVARDINGSVNFDPTVYSKHQIAMANIINFYGKKRIDQYIDLIYSNKTMKTKRIGA